jgi:predicted DNA-binding antitoxin AbrB/MazE fold protein
MGKTIKAKFSKGVIKPLEKLEISEGKEVTVTIIDFPLKSKKDGFERAAGAWRGTIDAEKLIASIYADRLVETRKVPKL